MTTPSIPFSISLAALAITLVCFLFQVTRQAGMPPDDAFISMVYAKNMAAGHGPVYNVGEPPVEGYTNFLWVVMLAICGALGFDIPVAGQAMSIALAVAVLLGLFLLSRRHLQSSEHRWACALPPALLAGNPAFTFWTCYALETNLVLATLVATFLIMSFLPSQPSDRRSTAPYLWTGIVLFLLAITRFDAVLLSALIVLAIIGRDWFNGTASLRNWACLLTPLIVAYGAYSLWRHEFYGDILPNTYYAKARFHDYTTLHRGVSYLCRSLREAWGGYLFAFLSFTLLIPDLTTNKPAFAFATPIVVFGWLAYVVVIGGDNLASQRFTLPAIVLLYATCGARMGEAMRSCRASRPMVSATVALCISLGLACEYRRQSWFPVFGRHTQTSQWRKAVGLALKDATQDDAVVALIPAGIMKYYASRRAIDMLGLNDREIARTDMRGTRGRPGHEKYCGCSVLSRQPDVIVLQQPTELKTFDEVRAWAAEGTRDWASHRMMMDLVSQPDLEEKYAISGIEGLCGVLVLRDSRKIHLPDLTFP